VVLGPSTNGDSDLPARSIHVRQRKVDPGAVTSTPRPGQYRRRSDVHARGGGGDEHRTARLVFEPGGGDGGVAHVPRLRLRPGPRRLHRHALPALRYVARARRLSRRGPWALGARRGPCRRPSSRTVSPGLVVADRDRPAYKWPMVAGRRPSELAPWATNRSAPDGAPGSLWPMTTGGSASGRWRQPDEPHSCRHRPQPDVNRRHRPQPGRSGPPLGAVAGVQVADGGHSAGLTAVARGHNRAYQSPSATIELAASSRHGRPA